jgi:hypothetical protein
VKSHLFFIFSLIQKVPLLILDNNLCIFPHSADMDEANLKIRRLEATNLDLSRLLKKHERRSKLTKVRTA